MPKPVSEDPTESVSMSIPGSLLEKARWMAQEDHRTLSSWITELIRERIERPNA